MRIKKIRVPIYGSRVMFIESKNYDEIVRYFKRIDYDFYLNSEEIFACVVVHHTVEKGEKYNCIYFIMDSKNKYNKFDHGVIAHEALHIAHDIAEYKSHSNFSQEPLSYLVEYLVNEICKFLNVKIKLTKIR